MKFKPINKLKTLASINEVCVHWAGLPPREKERLKKEALLSLAFGPKLSRRWYLVVSYSKVVPCTLKHGDAPTTRGLCDEDICTLMGLSYSPPKKVKTMKPEPLLRKQKFSKKNR